LEGDDPPSVVLARKQLAIWAECDAERTVAALFPDADLALTIALENPVTSRVSEIDLPVLVHHGISGELVSLSEQFQVISPGSECCTHRDH